MADYESKSVALWAYALAGLVGVGGLALALSYGFPRRPESWVGVAIVLSALLLANFGVLTVRVTDRDVSWFFGRGPIGRRIAIERIRSAEPRRSAWYWGWGIRWTPRGWLWRSNGLDCVWLELTSGSRVGVGTQDPEGLTRVILERLEPRP